MNCPTCNAESIVTRTHGTRRTRRCLGCGTDFETVEVYADIRARTKWEAETHAEARHHIARIWAVVNGNGDR